jgi:hypothetical protein
MMAGMNDRKVTNAAVIESITASNQPVTWGKDMSNASEFWDSRNRPH